MVSRVMHATLTSAHFLESKQPPKDDQLYSFVKTEQGDINNKNKIHKIFMEYYIGIFGRATDDETLLIGILYTLKIYWTLQ